MCIFIIFDQKYIMTMMHFPKSSDFQHLFTLHQEELDKWTENLSRTVKMYFTKSRLDGDFPSYKESLKRSLFKLTLNVIFRSTVALSRIEFMCKIEVKANQ